MATQPEAPVPSIYDMLVERRMRLAQRGLLKQLASSKTAGQAPLPKRQSEQENLATPKLMKPKWLKFKTQEDEPEINAQQRRMRTVVGAANLVKKQTPLQLQPPTKKEVLTELLEKMSGKMRKYKQKVKKCGSPSSRSSDSSSLKHTNSRSMLKAPAKKRNQAGGGDGHSNSDSSKRVPLSPKKSNQRAARRSVKKSRAAKELVGAGNVEKPNLVKLERKRLFKRKSKTAIKPRTEGSIKAAASAGMQPNKRHIGVDSSQWRM